MSYWTGGCKSNLFKVRDEEAFKKFCEMWNCKYLEYNQDLTELEREVTIAKYGKDQKLVGFISEAGHLEYSRFPTKEEVESGKYGEGDIIEDFESELFEHVAPGSVAMIIECGADSSGYVDGWIEVFTPGHLPVSTSLSTVGIELVEKNFGIKDIVNVNNY